MSRNLCKTRCHFCGSRVVVEEPPRPITKTEAGCYFDEYEGMLVARAHCYVCEAKYLAWCDESTRRYAPRAARPAPDGASPLIVDLSFRSTFNDAPGQDDLPTWAVEWKPHLTAWPRCSAAHKLSHAEGHPDDCFQCKLDATNGPFSREVP